jgi:hypothetical protein
MPIHIHFEYTHRIFRYTTLPIHHYFIFLNIISLIQLIILHYRWVDYQYIIYLIHIIQLFQMIMLDDQILYIVGRLNNNHDHFLTQFNLFIQIFLYKIIHLYLLNLYFTIIKKVI